jgi:hypothetical protein
MQILSFDSTNEAFLNWYVAEAGQNPSDFIALGPNSPNGRALHRRLPPPGGLLHFPIDDGLDLLLVFSDAEWPLICAAASIAPPPGAVPVELQQSLEMPALTTPFVSFRNTTGCTLRQFDDHPVMAHFKQVGNNPDYPDAVSEYYILKIDDQIWAELFLGYNLGDPPDQCDDPCPDERDVGRPFIGSWSGTYLDADRLLRWFVQHGQRPPETLITDLLEFAVLKVRQLPPITAPLNGAPTMADPNRAAPLPPSQVEETPPTADEEILNGPFGLGGFAFGGTRIRGIPNRPWKLLDALWKAPGRTLEHAEIVKIVWGDPNASVANKTIQTHCSTLRKLFRENAISCQLKTVGEPLRVELMIE